MDRSPITILAHDIHARNVKAGWWNDSTTYGGDIADRYMVPTKIALMHSELSEALEGQRKSLPDDHLPQYPMESVEYADAIIRILDVCGYKHIPIGEIIAAKLAYNSTREDHKLETRNQPGGKAV